ncbi:hypothetical protein HYDPIDRAFT_29812 [Hydnomerulius pinastri MD-312]|uniref:Uncharacterized protein n=1 Tax=Hydnomerulius pinastri MD-312 TaxID=994086 RepID=A0A0C9W7G4_9AGAM|nr:hypothetical protein HYDPIDRAFT_29812 [Hydnomerulius pinastri MD-312]
MSSNSLPTIHLYRTRHMRWSIVDLSREFATATKPSGRKGRRDERAALPGCVELAIGMKVMINVETDLDVANGSRGEITKSVLDEHESTFDPTSSVVILDYPPAYILVKLSHMRATQLEGLEKEVLPLVPLERIFTFGARRKLLLAGSYL